MGRIAGHDAAAALIAADLDAALMPLPVDKDVFHAIPLYTETDEDSGRVYGREIGLVWLRQLEHPLLEPLTGIVRGRTANSSRGESPAATAPTSPAPSQTTTKPPVSKTQTGKFQAGKAQPQKSGAGTSKKAGSTATKQLGKNTRRRHPR